MAQSATGDADGIKEGRVNTVNVLQEILAWSADRPTWQRDALRRLVATGELSDDDIRALTEICKGDHGLVEKPEAKLLATEHVPAAGGTAAAVSLASIFHHQGVNALAEDQTLKFDPGLTIVYGDNGGEAKPIGDVDSLEIFLSHAGIAMERALLERRIRDLTAGQRVNYSD